MEPIGVNKILVEKYGYEWVNGKAWRPGTAPEPEIPTVDVTPGPLPDWITAPPADAFVTQALETLTNPITGEEFTVPTGGYTVNVSASEDSDVPSTEPTIPVTTPETDPVPSEPISLEERLEQLQASINELQKKYEEALEKLEQANARIVELEGQQSETSNEGSNPDEVAIEPDETPSPAPQQPATEEEVDASTPEAPEVSEPEPTPAPSYPEPTGVDKILVENYGYEWINGQAWKPGTTPDVETVSDIAIEVPNFDNTPVSSGVTEDGSPPSGLPGAGLNKGSLTATTSTLFDRTLDVYGVKLLVGGASGTQDAVPDAWAHKVAQSYVMLMDPTGSNIDVSAQENMKKILAGEDGTWHEGFGTSQRILKGTGSEYPLNPLQDLNEGQLDAQYGAGTEALLHDIMQDMVWYQNSTGVINSGDGDIQELFEHVLHTLHPWGVRGAVEGSQEALNYTKVGSREAHDANDSSWKTSELYLAMKEAIDNGVFDPSGYAADPLNDPEQFHPAATEYTYILNFSMWEMGKEFWLDKVNGEGALEGEWSVTASDPAGVLAENPLGHALFMKYFDPVLSKPDFATLRSMFQDNDQGASGYVPDETPSPAPQQPATEEEVDASTPEAPEVSEPEPTPAPSYPEPTGVDKILVENYGYEWVNGKAWRPGTAPDVETVSDITIEVLKDDPDVVSIRTFHYRGDNIFDIDGEYHDPSWFFVDAADLNSDEKSDLVIAPVGHVLDYERAYDPIVLLSQPGSGYIQAQVSGDWDGLLFPSKVVIADLDNDYDLDLVFPANGYDAPPFPQENFGIFLQDDLIFTDVNSNYPTLMNSMRGDGAGSFYHSAAVGDLNNDLVPDIFIGDMRSPFIIDGETSSLIRLDYIMDPNEGGNQVLTSEAVDVVGQARLELILAGHLFSSVILEFDETFSIMNKIVLPTPNSFDDDSINILGIAAGDLNNDGLSDLVFTLSDENYDNGGMQVLLQTENSTFTDVTDVWLAQPISSFWTKTVKMLDLDHDGDLDVFLGQTEPSALTYYENVEGHSLVAKTIEDPMNGWGRFHVGIDEEYLTAYLLNNTSDGDLFIAEVSFA
jgi:hypothetical protein